MPTFNKSLMEDMAELMPNFVLWGALAGMLIICIYPGRELRKFGETVSFLEGLMANPQGWEGRVRAQMGS